MNTVNVYDREKVPQILFWGFWVSSTAMSNSIYEGKGVPALKKFAIPFLSPVKWGSFVCLEEAHLARHLRSQTPAVRAMVDAQSTTATITNLSYRRIELG